MNKVATNPVFATSEVAGIMEPAAWVALLATGATVLLLAALHVLSPEFSPSWRVISEYALGHYGWVLSLMFLCWGIGSWALSAALRPQITTRAGEIGRVVSGCRWNRRSDGLGV